MMSPSRSRWKVLPRYWALLGLLLVLPAAGADPAAPLRYRRVFVPQEDLDREVRGLLPLKREEFERRVARASASDTDLQSARVRVERATYRARLETGGLVGGTAQLSIALGGEESAALQLEPWNLAIETAAWQGSPQRPARIGNDSDGKLTCLVERGGTLELAWSRGGQRDGRGDWKFDLRIPPAPINRFEIELPAGMTLESDRGVVARPAPRGPGTAPRASDRWTLDAGGATELTLRAVRDRPRPPGQPPVMVKDQTTYVVERGTIDVQASLEIGVLHESLSQIVLELDRPLQLLAVRRGGESLAWSPLPVSDGSPRVLVSLPAGLSGKSETLEVSAATAWTSHAPLRLPRVHVADAVWQEGRSTVLASDSLELTATPLGGSRQTAFSASSPARPSDQWQFQHFLPGAAIEIVAPDSPPPLVETSGLSLQFDASQVTGTWIGQLSATGGRRFSLEAVIPRAWIVDAVDVHPADMLDDRGLQTRGSGGQSLRLALRRPVDEGRSVQVTVRAHRRRPPLDRQWTEDMTALVRFADVRTARRLVSLQALDPATQIDLSGEEGLRRLDPAALAASDLRLFETTPGPLFFDLDRRADPLRARLVQTTPRFRADLSVRAEVTADRVRQLIRVRCLPEASSLGQFILHCSPAPPELVQWRMIGEDAREFIVRRLDQPALRGDEASFELTLQRPRQAPFQIEAEFTRPLPEGRPISLASLPAAAVQTGELEIHATGGMPLTIDAADMRSLPPHSTTPRVAATLRGRYRYEPGRSNPARVSVPPARRTQPSLWASSLRLTSHLAADGSGQHEAEIELHSAGHDRLTFRLPPPANNVRAEVDPPSLASLSALSPDPLGEYSIALPVDAQRVVVRLSYATKQNPLGWRAWGTFDVLVPQLPVPVLATSWWVHTAPGLRVAADQSPIANPPSAPNSSVASWTSYSLPLQSGPVASVRVYCPAALQAWSWCLALASAALAMRLSAGRVSRLILAIAIVALAALLLPGEFAPLVTGMLVGLATGGAATLLKPWPAAPVDIGLPSHRSTASLLRPAGWLLLAAGAASLVQAAPPIATPASGNALPRVVFPVDAQRLPAGDYVFLEPAFYDALVQLTDRAADSGPAWLLSQGVYRATVSPAAEGKPIRIDQIAATIDFETLRPDATVELPLQRSQIHLVEGRARLDTEAIVPDWSPTGSRLRLVATKPGKHRLELTFAVLAKADAEAGDTRIEFDIPPIANSRLIFPAGSGPVPVPAALGATAGDAAGEHSVPLGPIPRLVLGTLAEEASADAPRVEVEQLLLWKIRPGSVVAESKLRVRPLGGVLRGIALEIDPRLRPLPQLEAGPILRQWVEEGTATSTLHLEFAEPLAEETVVPISLLWTGSSGLGNLALPKIAVRSDKLSRAWTAISLASGLEWKSPPTARPTDPPVAAFASAWGQPLPETAIALDDAQPAPLLSTRPSETRIEAKQTLDCSLSQRSAEVHLVAELSNVPPHEFQHRLDVAPGVRLSEVTVYEANRAVGSRWRQSAGNTVLIGLSQPAAAQQRIEVVGQVALGRGESMLTLPLVEYRGAVKNEFSVRIFRRSDVQLAVAAVEPAWTSLPLPGADHATDRPTDLPARLVAMFDRSEGGSASPPSIAVSPNRPEVTGWLLTRLIPGQREWTVEIDCLATVQSGVLDTLRLELPASIAGPLEVTPAVEHQLNPLAGQSAQVLTIRPQRAIADELRLTIRGTLRGATSQSASLPVVSLLDQPRVRSLAALPARAGSQKLVWETSGLQAVDPLSLSLPATLTPADSELFEVVAPRASALVQARNLASPAAPRVSLAEHRIALDDERRLVGRSTFDVLPSGARQLDLSVPPGTRLLSATIEGVPAQCVSRGAGRWSVATISDRWPQRLDVYYAASRAPRLAELDVQTSSASLHAPRLEGTAVQRTLWIATLPEGTSLARREEAHSIGLREEQVERLEAAAAMLQTIADLRADDASAALLGDSFAAWQVRFDRLRPAVAALQPDQSELAAPLQRRVQSASRTADQAGEQLAAAGVAVPPRDAIVNAVHQEQERAPEGASTQRLSFASERSSLPVQETARSSRGSDLRLAWAAAIVAGALLSGWLLAWPTAQAWLTRHAPFVVALAGALWLAGGVAAWMGWLLIGLAAWLAVRWPWTRVASEPLSGVTRRPL